MSNLSPLRNAPLEGQSSYREAYAGTSPHDRARPVRQPPQLTTSKAAPGHFTTTNQAAFDQVSQSPRDRTTSFKPKLGEVQSAPFTGNSSYQSDFPGHHTGTVVRSKPPRESLQKSAAAPGTFATTNQVVNSAIVQALQEGTISRTSPLRQKNDGIVANAPFEGKSSYQDQYTGQSNGLTSPRRHQAGSPLRKAPDNRDFLTTNGSAFHK